MYERDYIQMTLYTQEIIYTRHDVYKTLVYKDTIINGCAAAGNETSIYKDI